MGVLSKLSLIFGVLHILPFVIIMWTAVFGSESISNIQVSGAAVLAALGWAFVLFAIKFKDKG